MPLSGPPGDPARRRVLLLPALVAIVSGVGWLAAGLIWGVAWPALAGEFTLERALRQVFGISLVAGPTVTAFVFFSAERLLRAELPRLIPDGALGALRVARLRVRTRLLAVFLLIGLMPLAVLAVAALTRAGRVSAVRPSPRRRRGAAAGRRSRGARGPGRSHRGG